MGGINEIFWSEKFWLPENITWADVAPGAHGINHTNHMDLIWTFPITLAILIIRYIFENYVSGPFGLYLGISNKKTRPPTPNATLEEIYNQTPLLKPEDITNIAKKLDMNQRDVERWWRKRRSQNKVTKLSKFNENTWKIAANLFTIVFGVIVLWDQPYFTDFVKTIEGFPHHDITRGLWWYFMIYISLFWSLLLTHFFESKRKDFWTMFVHHIISIASLIFIWFVNLQQMGIIVTFLHDISEIFAYALKAYIYYKPGSRMCNVLLGMLNVMWIFARLYLYPRLIYRNWLYFSHPPYGAYYLLLTLALSLLAMHVTWTILIFRLTFKTFIRGSLDCDDRSGSEPENNISSEN